MVRARWIGLVLAALLALAGCQEKNQACNADNCAGCCDAQSVCQLGRTHEVCGARGAACRDCGEEACQAGACTRYPCAGVDCDGHGSCDLTDGAVRCTCDPGYVVEGELHCLPDPDCVKLGESCEEDTDCCSRMCVNGYEGRYCAGTGCLVDEDCVDHSSSESAMCCFGSGAEPEENTCWRLKPGCECGNRDRTCGERCACGSDTNCQPGSVCIDGGGCDYCAHPCDVDSDCYDCEIPTLPGTFFRCITVSGGQKLCMDTGDYTCRSTADCVAQCHEDAVCIPYLTADGYSLEGYCGRRGPLDTGEVCDPDDDRCKGFCRSASPLHAWRCSSVCGDDADCPADMMCFPQSFCAREPCDDPLNNPGIPMCVDDLRCASRSDCQADLEACVAVRARVGDDSMATVCQPKGGLLPTGADCDAGLDPATAPPEQVCETRMCIDDYCSEVCRSDADCPAGVCQPRWYSGQAVPVCVRDLRCERPADCPAGRGCRPVPAADGVSLEGRCFVGGYLPTGAICDPTVPPLGPAELRCETAFCYEQAPGDTICSEVCVETADCPAWMVCELYEFCLADPCTEPANLASIDLCVAAP